VAQLVYPVLLEVLTTKVEGQLAVTTPVHVVARAEQTVAVPEGALQPHELQL
jgi:hypothetical protein